MKNDSQIRTIEKIQPMEINQALIGLEISAESDASLLRYFDYFIHQVPTHAAYFIHVLPDFDIKKVIVEKDLFKLPDYQRLNDSCVNEMKAKIISHISKHDKIYVEYDVKNGDTLQEFLSTADELEIDLLVIGQGKNKQKHNILAKNLARKTKANALIIPEGATTSISKILVPIDFSNNSIRTLQAAISLCKQLKQPAEIICLYVYSIPSLKHFKMDSGWIQTMDTVKSNVMDGFNAFIETYAGDFKNKIEKVIVEKSKPGIAAFITDYAKEHACDLLFLGAKGHSKVQLLLMGSVTEEVLDRNPGIPTMIIK